MSTNYTVYIRASTADQVQEHQKTSIKNWFEDEGLQYEDADKYVDIGSGAKDDREQFQDLFESIEDGEYDVVVCWEISRISRSGETLQRFFNACEDTETEIVITDGAVDRITPDGQGRFVADVIGMVYQQERRTLIRRTQAGVQRARDQGKWTGKPPVGFIIESGFLKPNLNPDYEKGETGYFDVVDAMESINSGDSYNKTAQSTPNVTRQTLSNIDQDEDRRAWYLEQEADDERVQDAIDGVESAELA